MFRLAFERLKETHFATRLDRWMTGMIVVLLVAFGFLLGRWTSLTNTAVPIVFQEAPGETSAAASAEDLRALVAGSATETTPSSPPPASTQPTPRLRPAGEATAGRRPPTTTSDNERLSGAFVASVNGKKYYRASCTEVRRIKEENKVWFDSEAEAKESGLEPSACVLGKKR